MPYTPPMDHDHSYKLLFSRAERVADLLRGFVPGVGLTFNDLFR